MNEEQLQRLTEINEMKYQGKITTDEAIELIDVEVFGKEPEIEPKKNINK